MFFVVFFFSSRRRHTRWNCDWSSDVCSSDLDQPGMTFLRQDVSALGNVPGQVDAIFHLASSASPRDYLAHPIETLRAGSLGTQNCLELARTKRARFLLASTSEVYGNPQIHPQTEDYWGY